MIRNEPSLIITNRAALYHFFFLNNLTSESLQLD